MASTLHGRRGKVSTARPSGCWPFVMAFLAGTVAQAGFESLARYMLGYISPVMARERGHLNHMYPDDCSFCKTVTLHETHRDGTHCWCRACGLLELLSKP